MEALIEYHPRKLSLNIRPHCINVSQAKPEQASLCDVQRPMLDRIQVGAQKHGSNLKSRTWGTPHLRKASAY